MTASTGVRIGVLGATGALGSEVLSALDASAIRVAELVASATDRSLGEDIEFQGQIVPVAAELPSLRGLDLLFCCAPAEASLAALREALRAEVPVIDCSGALLASAEVPLGVALLSPGVGAAEPVVVAPPGAALPWAIALAPLHAEAGLRRVLGTVLDAASAAGRGGIDMLSAGSLALFNQQDPSQLDAAGPPRAFDCLPAEDAAADEAAVAVTLQRLLGVEIPVALNRIEVPAFVGQASSLAVETEQPLEPKRAEEVLAGAPGIERWSGGGTGPNLRSAAGRDLVIAGPVRRDPTAAQGLLFWIATDLLRLAATNAVALATARLAAT
jgi:aspartate-semialdehyde dehydrogenase